MLARRDARGVVATLTHDALGRLVQVSYPDPSENVAHAYDQGTNGIGRLTGRIDPGGEYAFAYNERGLLRRESRTVLGNTYVTKYRYNKDDDLRRVIYPSGRYVTYGRDAAGRVRRVVSLENDVETVLARKIAYLPFGPMTGLTYGNGVSATLAYDGRYHMTSRSFQGSGALEAVLSASLPRTYQYDAMDRLIGAQGVFGDLVYEYDPVGNRLSETRNGQTSLYQYDAAGRLTSVDGPVPRTFSYDVAGNVVGLDNLTLTYNQAGRLASVAGPEGAVAEYTYNALEQRVVKKTGGRRIFHYDMQGNLIAENPRRQGIRKEYVWLNGELLAMIRSLPEPKTDKIFYYANDHLGTPQAMTNDKKHVVWQARYDPFGAAALGRANTRTSNLRLPGQYYDDEIGLHYNWHRYYDPGIGRYLRVDPAGLNGELNYYSYASDNSISHSDISGLKVFKCCRDTQINKAIDNTLHLFGLKHCFLKTDSKEAGMGPLGAGPLPSFPILTPTEITNHTGQSLISNCKKMKCVDETCVNQELQIGKHIGEWSPWNNCNTFVDEILEKCHQDHATCCDE